MTTTEIIENIKESYKKKESKLNEKISELEDEKKQIELEKKFAENDRDEYKRRIDEAIEILNVCGFINKIDSRKRAIDKLKGIE